MKKLKKTNFLTLLIPMILPGRVEFYSSRTCFYQYHVIAVIIISFHLMCHMSLYLKVRLWVLKQDHPWVHVSVDISLVP